MEKKRKKDIAIPEEPNTPQKRRADSAPNKGRQKERQKEKTKRKERQQKEK